MGGVWGWAFVALLIGFVPGLLFFVWVTSPFGPGLWKLSPMVSRLLLTVSQFIRGRGVLVKLKGDKYRVGTFVPESDGGPAVAVEGRTIPIDPDTLKWGLFGKKPFAVTWEPGTDLHEMIGNPDAAEADNELGIDMGALHRHLEGGNNSVAIDRTEEHAKAEYSGGEETLSEMVMAVLIIAMLLLGSMTSYLMIG